MVGWSVRGIIPFSSLQLLAGSAIFAAGYFACGFLNGRPKRQIIQSPREQLLSTLSEDALGKLPYPPDCLPGTRDVNTPYGSIRVYEWGPKDGRKVLLVHGVSTPCVALGAVAHGLAENGYRVMLFDLFGRGFSDDPADIPQDVRLFSSQILLVLASSPLSWTGAQSGGFSLIGYSLGGGISVGFTSHFPSLVNSLVLIAPAGLIRMHNISRGNRLIYSEGIIPEFILSAAVKRRLKTPLYPTKVPKLDESKTEVAEAAAAELPPAGSLPKVPLSRSRPNITIEKCVVFQVDHHRGFVPAFMSSIRSGPITGQHEDWKRIGQRLTQQKGKARNEESTDGLEKGKVLIVTGNNDPIIKKKELIEDATSVFEGNVVFRFIDAGHEAPVLKGDEVVRHILQFWNTE